MKSEFALAFNQICAEYNLPREVVLEAVRAALATAYRRDWKIPPNQNLTTEISLETGLARIYLEMMVADPVEDPQLQIGLAEARRINAQAQVGDLLMRDVTPENFGRIAAQTAKQVITQRLREAERELQFNRFSRQEGEIIIGTIQSITPQGVTLHLERTEEAVMPKREQIPGERYVIHQKIRVYVLEVRRTPRGPEITVSRSHPNVLRRMLELEVPEIRGGQVEIKAIAREAGILAKVAVVARQPGLDPVGACVGMRGIRIQTISRELNGERLEVVEWSPDPAVFIANALRPATILSVVLDEHNPGGRTASVVVADEQLSLAIGRSGQNARLAAKLTNWRVDIQGASEAALWAMDQINQLEGLKEVKEIATLIPTLAALLRSHEAERYPLTDEDRRVIKTVVEAVRRTVIERREADHPAARQAKARRTAQETAEAERRAAVAEARASIPPLAYELPLAELALSEKTQGHLARNGLHNVGMVMERLAMGDEGLLMLDGIGAKVLMEIRAAVDQLQPRLMPSVPAATEPEVVAAVVEEVTPVAEPTPVAEATAVAEAAEVAETPAAVVVEEAAPAETVVRVEPVVATLVAEAPVVEAPVVEAPVVEVPVVEAASPEAPAADSGLPLKPLPVELPPEVLEQQFEDEEEPEHPKKKGKKGKRSADTFYDEDERGVVVIRRRRGGRAQDWDQYGDY